MAADRPSQSDFDDDFEKMWAENVESKTTLCSVGDIDPSQPGWEIVLHYEGKDPEKSEGKLGEDYRFLLSLQDIGILKVELIESRNIIVLSHEDGCPLEQFIREQRELFERYSPVANAPQSARRKLGQREEAETVRPPADDAPTLRPPSSDSVEKKVAQVALKPRKDAQKILQAVGEGKQLPEEMRQIEHFEFGESIITTIPFQNKHQEQIREGIKRVCEEENLDHEETADEAGGYWDIIISKKEGVEYTQMKLENVKTIYDLHPLHGLALTFM